MHIFKIKHWVRPGQMQEIVQPGIRRFVGNEKFAPNESTEPAVQTVRQMRRQWTCPNTPSKVYRLQAFADAIYDA